MMKNLETCCGLYGEDLKALFGDDRRIWDEPGGQCAIVAVVPETGKVERWKNKMEAWNEIEEAIGKRATGKCKSLQEAVWLFLDKVPFELFIGHDDDDPDDDAKQWLSTMDGLGTLLRSTARNSGRSMAQLSDASGVNRVSLARFMRGETDLSLSAAWKLMRHFGLVVVPESQVKRKGACGGK